MRSVPFLLNSTPSISLKTGFSDATTNLVAVPAKDGYSTVPSLLTNVEGRLTFVTLGQRNMPEGAIDVIVEGILTSPTQPLGR